MNRLSTIALALSAAATLSAPVASAQPGDSLGADWRQQQGEARQRVRDGSHISLERAVEAVRRRTPGRVLDAGLEPGPGGRTVYRVRWAATDGRRIDFLVDAATGQVLSGG